MVRQRRGGVVGDGARRRLVAAGIGAIVAAIAGCEEPTATRAERHGDRGELASTTTAAAAGAASTPIVVRDDQGREVALTQPARRIASLSPALTEALFAVGCGDRLVLRDRWSDHPAAALSVPAIDALAPSAEAIVAARPELVLVSFPAGRLRAALDTAGVAWVGLAPANLAAIGADLRRVGALCGAPGHGEATATTLARRLAALAAAIGERPRPRIYLELDEAAGGRTWTAGADTFAVDVLRAAGGDTAFPELVGWPQVAREAVIAADPDVVLLAKPRAEGEDDADLIAAFAARPGFAGLASVRAGRVLRVDPAIFGRPGPRVVDAVERLARSLHPRLDTVERGAAAPPRSAAPGAAP